MIALKNAAIAIGMVLALSFAILNSAIAQSAWHVERTIEVGGAGGMDYLTVDPRTHRLYVPRTTHTMVIDGLSGKILGDIPGQTKSHGVALVPRLNRGFITDGGGKGSVVILTSKLIPS